MGQEELDHQTAGVGVSMGVGFPVATDRLLASTVVDLTVRCAEFHLGFRPLSQDRTIFLAASSFLSVGVTLGGRAGQAEELPQRRGVFRLFDVHSTD